MGITAEQTKLDTVARPAGPSPRSRSAVALRCSVGAAVLFGAIAGFQAALAAGVPWGEAAWGGSQAELGAGLRVASAIQAVLVSGFALVVLRRAGHQVWSPLPERWLPAAVWILAAYMILGTAMNAASRSSIERAWAPVALILAVLCAVVAMTSRVRARPSPPWSHP